VNDLSEVEIHALNEALDDEYRAWATYEQVIADFGDVRPFTHIREAEARHIGALRSLFGRYRRPVPGNPWGPETVTRYASLQEACEAGVVAEIANGEMYDRLLKGIEHENIAAVLRRLQEASQQRHLAAFRRCAQRSAGCGRREGRPSR
jgi:rubrerythrin